MRKLKLFIHLFFVNFPCFQFQIYISKSYDASTHFESTCTDVLEMYERITGSPFDFSKVTRNLEDDS
ncbi:unnamed protein product [Schistosoma margrebowiei]|uniref:Uncharacterized protein n=1 Tax=Schistosoma margrebowiei TaxID=48269 RepID=A0A183LU25_9TREM|nr:unnamed protein product [Schistosoma margrebowiei]